MKLDKSALLTRIRTLQRELDSLVDIVLALEVSEPEQDQPQQNMEGETWMTAKQICKHYKISSSTFYGWVRDGFVSPGISFGPRSKRWKLSELEAWEASRRTNNAEERQNTTNRRGRISRVKKFEVFCRV